MTLQTAISSESPACMREGWLLHTTMHNWTNVIKNVSTSTVRRRLCEAGLYGIIAVKKSLLRLQNHIRWLQWAKAHTDCRIKQWNKVLWTDESIFEIFVTNGQVFVRRRVDVRPVTPCIRPTVKHGGGSVMEYAKRGSFANFKIGDCTRGRTNWFKPAIRAYCRITQSNLENGL